MKRMFIAAAAIVASSAAFAAPASANLDSSATTADMAAPCWTYEPLATCVKRVITNIADIEVAAVCNSGEALTTCAERVARETPDDAITRAFAIVNSLGYTIGNVIVTVDREVDNAMAAAEGACERIFPTCVALL
jgi:hypothetical protein